MVLQGITYGTTRTTTVCNGKRNEKLFQFPISISNTNFEFDFELKSVTANQSVLTEGKRGKGKKKGQGEEEEAGESGKGSKREGVQRERAGLCVGRQFNAGNSFSKQCLNGRGFGYARGEGWGRWGEMCKFAGLGLPCLQCRK